MTDVVNLKFEVIHQFQHFCRMHGHMVFEVGNTYTAAVYGLTEAECLVFWRQGWIKLSDREEVNPFDKDRKEIFPQELTVSVTAPVAGVESKLVA